jgi:hypothetical protein
MISSLSSVNELVAVIRSQLNASAKVAPGRRRAPARSAAQGKYAESNLGALIEARVKAIAPDDPQRGRKAFKVFLEVVLLSHFGEALVNNARFHQMVSDVQDAMEADTACSALIARAIAHLLEANH